MFAEVQRLVREQVAQNENRPISGGLQALQSLIGLVTSLELDKKKAAPVLAQINRIHKLIVTGDRDALESGYQEFYDALVRVDGQLRSSSKRIANSQAYLDSWRKLETLVLRAKNSVLHEGDPVQPSSTETPKNEPRRDIFGLGDIEPVSSSVLTPTVGDEALTEVRAPEAAGRDESLVPVTAIDPELTKLLARVDSLKSALSNAEAERDAERKKVESAQIDLEVGFARRKAAETAKSPADWNGSGLDAWLGWLHTELSSRIEALKARQPNEYDLYTAERVRSEVEQVQEHLVRWQSPFFTPAALYWVELCGGLLNARQLPDLLVASSANFEELRQLNGFGVSARRALLKWLKQEKAAEPIIPVPMVSRFNGSLHREVPGSAITTHDPGASNLVIQCVQIGFRLADRVMLKAQVKRYAAPLEGAVVSG